MDWVCSEEKLGHEGMAHLMKGGVALFSLTHNHALALSAHHNLVFGPLQVNHLNHLFVEPSREQGSLVYQIFQISSRKPWGASGNYAQVHIR